MKKVIIACLACMGIGSYVTYRIDHRSAYASSRDMTAPGVKVCFSPHGGCTEACVEQIDAAQHEILVQAYSFTSKPIAEALMAAHKDRNVNVRVIVDKSQLSEHGSEIDEVFAAGIEVWIDGKHPIAHAKLIIIDESVVIGGSFNFTKQAESNSENLIIMPASEGVGPQYVANWNAHLAHSFKYEGRQK